VVVTLAVLLTVLELLTRVELVTALLDLVETLLAEVELLVDNEETELVVLDLVDAGDEVGRIELLLVLGLEDVLRELVERGPEVDVLLNEDVSGG
jgi:hypothetical protein